MKIIFFGTPAFIDPVFHLLEKHFNVTVGNNLSANQISKLSPDLFVVAAYGKILPPELLAIPKFGSLNIHPSLLPKYRGPSPVQSALLNGDKTIGVTIIKLDEEIDHGPMIVQVKEAILPTDTAQSLHERLFKIGADLLIEYIPKYVKGEIKITPQDHSQASFTEHLSRESGYVDLNNPPPKEQLERMIKAYYPWPGVWTKFEIRNSRFAARRAKFEILKFLPGQKLQVGGGKPMSTKDFLNGYPELQEKIRILLK